jgi:hypothetical protein
MRPDADGRAYRYQVPLLRRRTDRERLGAGVSEPQASHYPTSADLAALRYDLMPSWWQGPYPHRMDAHADEREHGIGWTSAQPCPDGHHGTDCDALCNVCSDECCIGARREAARIRHAAFSVAYTDSRGLDGMVRLDGTPLHPEIREWLDPAMLTFAGSYADWHAGHGGAAGSFWPDCPLCPEGCHPDCGPINLAAGGPDGEHAHENIDGRCWHEDEDGTGQPFEYVE